MENITKEYLESVGFKEYEVPSIKRGADMFLQKKIYIGGNEEEELYIDAYMYDLKKYSIGLDQQWSFETQLGEYRAFNVTAVQWKDCSLDEIEEFFKNLYYFSKMMERKK